MPPVGLLDREREALAVGRERRPEGAVWEPCRKTPRRPAGGQDALDEGASEQGLGDVRDAPGAAGRRGGGRLRGQRDEQCDCEREAKAAWHTPEGNHAALTHLVLFVRN